MSPDRSSPDIYSLGRVAPLAAALFSMAAAATHIVVLGDHYDEWWLYGLFFAAAAWAQIIWALWVVYQPSALLYQAGAIGNAAIIGMWALSRTVGIPLGPSAGDVEDATPVDILATSLEWLIVLLCFGLLVASRENLGRRLSQAQVWVGLAVVCLALIPLSTAGLIDAELGGGHGHGSGMIVAEPEAHQDEHQEAPTVLKTEFQPPQPYDLNTIYQKLLQDCSNNPSSCFQQGLITITETYGPSASLETFGKLQENGVISVATDDHHISHAIGKKTAERFGANIQAFLLCPTSFNYGCQHGFFQYALGAAGEPEKTAMQICGSFDDSFSFKFKFDCYHGVGHGVLMAKDYNLTGALNTCDKIDTPLGQDGCWQGVFMENVNAGTGLVAQQSGTFSKTDPLEPCNSVQEKYRQECFVNQAGWLVKFFNLDLQQASSACLQAPAPRYVSGCLQSLGLMVTNPAWQASLLKNANQENFEKTAWSLCTQFPTDHIDQCVIGGVHNIMNFDKFEVLRVRNFCDTVNAVYRNLCYQQIGWSLKNAATDNEIVIEKCATFESPFKDECLIGAGFTNI